METTLKDIESILVRGATANFRAFGELKPILLVASDEGIGFTPLQMRDDKDKAKIAAMIPKLVKKMGVYALGMATEGWLRSSIGGPIIGEAVIIVVSNPIHQYLVLYKIHREEGKVELEEAQRIDNVSSRFFDQAWGDKPQH